MGKYMSLEMVLFAAVVSTAAPAELDARLLGPVGSAMEQHRRERVAQAKRDTEVPRALPGRSESSEEAGPGTRRKAMKPAKPAEQARTPKSKDKPGEGGKKALEGIR
jgi:hypothetical protein